MIIFGLGGELILTIIILFTKSYHVFIIKDDIAIIEKELSGDFEDCVVKLFKDPSEADAEDLKKSMIESSKLLQEP